MPPALKEQPKLPSHLFIYYDAYHELKHHRTRSEAGHNPILYSDMVLHAQIFGFFQGAEEFRVFATLIRACDNAFLGYAEELQRKEMTRVKAQKK